MIDIMIKVIGVLCMFIAASCHAAVGLAGVNIAGCDFGTDYLGNGHGQGSCPGSSVARGQMTHFINVWGMNIFRIPVGWQPLVNYTLGGPLEPTFFARFDSIMQACIALNVYCIIDIHNYARWNGEIIGQSTKAGGPTDAHFVSIWSQLATKYYDKERVVFGIMNEPHDLDMARWAQTVQKAVTAIRNAGATSQLILLPSSNYSQPQNLANYSGPYLQNIVDYDGKKANLIFDLHEYYQAPGVQVETNPCVTDHVSDAFAPATAWLKKNGRLALLTETGGRNDDGCVKYVCQALDYLIDNGVVWLGWTGWSAGQFSSTTYGASLTPFANGTDQYLLRKCIGPKIQGH